MCPGYLQFRAVSGPSIAESIEYFRDISGYRRVPEVLVVEK